MAGDIPSEKPASSFQTTLNYLDIIGKVGMYGGGTETVLGGGAGYGLGAGFSTLSSVATLGRIPPISAIPEVAAEAGALFAAPGILAAFAGADIYSLKTQLEFDQKYPEIALSVMQSTAMGPGL